MSANLVTYFWSRKNVGFFMTSWGKKMASIPGIEAILLATLARLRRNNVSEFVNHDNKSSSTILTTVTVLT